MNMVLPVAGCGELRRQARVARELGSEFVASVLEAGDRQLMHAPRTAQFIMGWPCDRSAAALAMRFNAALHSLARRGDLPLLSALYRGEHQDFDCAIADALAGEDDFIFEWMGSTPQTNEVGRAGAITAALMELRAVHDMPVELLEIGSSCGLNLNLARYGYDLGGVTAGDLASPVQVQPEWRGAPPRRAAMEIVSARGVDLRPLDANDAATQERLLCYIWADQPWRAQRLKDALAMARSHPPRLERGSAVPWLVERLAGLQAPGVCRVIFHSMVLQYLRADDRRAVVEMIRRAGAAATAERPLAWIGFEWTPDRSEVQLTLTSWPSGETRLLATCHAYGNWIAWKG